MLIILNSIFLYKHVYVCNERIFACIYNICFIKELENKVKDAINELEIVKDSKEYTFSSSVRVELERYFSGAKNNPKEEKRFKVQTAKREKLVKAGKEPDWKVVPPALVDLDAATSQICDILRELREDYKTRLEKTAFSPDEATVEIIDYLKEQASTFVYKVTKKLAKARALKLMEEVGIPEPAVRYKQYPFEFSGGYFFGILERVFIPLI